MDHLKFLWVSFEYLHMKRKKYYRERGRMDAKYIQRKSYPSPKKNPHVLPQGKLVFAGGQNPPRLSLLQKFKKDTLALSLLLFSLCRSNLYLSLSLQAFFGKPTPSTRYLFLFTSCPSTPQTPLSLSLSFF